MSVKNHQISASNNGGTAPRILIVDDDTDILESLKDIIELEITCEVETASNIFSARKIADKFNPDIALIDVQLGASVGTNLIPLFKSKNPDVICIVMTAYRDTEYAVNALRSGADDYLHKPLDPENLLVLIEKYSSRQKLVQAKKEVERRLKAVFEQSFQFIFLLSTDGAVIDVNETGLSLLKIEKSKVIGESIWNLFLWSDIGALRSRLLPATYADQDSKYQYFEMEIILGEEREPRVFEFVLKPLLDNEGKATHMILEGHDISEQKQAEQQLKKMALYDSLTGLPNYSMFLQHLSSALSQSQRNDRSFALAFIDMDDFKEINDSFGHQAGDEVLIEVGKRLQAEVRECDVVSRRSGDEFIILFHDVGSKGSMKRVLNRLIKEVSGDFLYRGKKIRISLSMGVALYPENGCDSETLLKCADEAMYSVKHQNKNDVAFFWIIFPMKKLKLGEIELAENFNGHGVHVAGVYI